MSFMMVLSWLGWFLRLFGLKGLAPVVRRRLYPFPILCAGGSQRVARDDLTRSRAVALPRIDHHRRRVTSCGDPVVDESGEERAEERDRVGALLLVGGARGIVVAAHPFGVRAAHHADAAEPHQRGHAEHPPRQAFEALPKRQLRAAQ